MSKICSPRRGLPSCGSCISLTQGLISLSLYKEVVVYFSHIPFNSCKKPLILLNRNYYRTFSDHKTVSTRRGVMSGVEDNTFTCTISLRHNSQFCSILLLKLNIGIKSLRLTFPRKNISTKKCLINNHHCVLILYFPLSGACKTLNLLPQKVLQEKRLAWHQVF